MSYKSWGTEVTKDTKYKSWGTPLFHKKVSVNEKKTQKKHHFSRESFLRVS